MTPLTPVGPAKPGERHHRGRGPTVIVVSRPHRRHLATLGLAGARPSETTTVAVTGRFVLPRLGPGQGGCAGRSLSCSSVHPTRAPMPYAATGPASP